MASSSENAVVAYIRSGNATNDDIDTFLDFCLEMCSGNDGTDPHKVRYEIYRIWARCLRHRRTHLNKHGHFDYAEELKAYLHHLTGGTRVNAEPPPDAIPINAEQFVRFVVRHFEDGF